MRAVKIIGKAFSIILTVILVFFLVCSVYTVLVRVTTDEPQPDVFGWSWAVVISGSMEPNIKVDDLIIVHRQNSYALKDVITFRSESGRSVITHRIVGETSVGFITRGDNNNVNDFDPITKDRIIGKVVMVIPGIGKFISLLQTPFGLLLILLVGILLIKAPNPLKKIKKKKKTAPDPLTRIEEEQGGNQNGKELD